MKKFRVKIVQTVTHISHVTVEAKTPGEAENLALKGPDRQYPLVEDAEYGYWEVCIGDSTKEVTEE